LNGGFGVAGLIGRGLRLLKNDVVLVFTTSETPDDREEVRFGHPLATIWKNGIFGFCGGENVQRRNFSFIAISMPERRQGCLAEVVTTLAEHLPGA
jgi:hypothetical protein